MLTLASIPQLKNLAALLTPDTTDMPTRRLDLDWLRIGVFVLLILYHTGMLYVENWGFHYKSSHRSSLLESLMLMIEPWRMACLWFISGLAIRFILAKVTVWRFLFYDP